VAYCGLKIITSLSLRFPDFQRGRNVIITENWSSKAKTPVLKELSSLLETDNNKLMNKKL
jgi:hypothetical protein